MFSKRLILSALAVTFFGITCQSLSAAAAAPVAAPTTTNNDLASLFLAQAGGRGYGSAKSEMFKMLQIKEAQLKHMIESNVFKDEKLKEATAALAQIQGDIQSVLLGGSYAGEIVAKGLAGDKNMKAFDEIPVSSLWDGIAKGMQLQFASAAGDFAREKTKKMFDVLGGGLIDTFTSQVRSLFSDLNASIFHGGMKPFDKSNLEAWANIINDSMITLNTMVENGAGFGLRGMDITSRQSEEESSSEPAPKPDQAKIGDAWTEFATINAEEFLLFIEQMQQAKEYYDDGDMIIFYADKICQMLAVIYKLLDESKASFKDFTTKLSSNKMMLKGMQSYFKNYFTYLYKAVCVSAGDEQGAKTGLILGASNNYMRGMGDGGFNNGAFSGSPGF
ncbi:MAG: hypothetical protein US49_C0005G0018 [candidate division TM6 bacterium GW2011_GWF2_37_49]|nr:MAG: hypothetical protein US49_C0005G0018 [candidate division TM6 bacterium GW2011_GWF2_37_49]